MRKRKRKKKGDSKDHQKPEKIEVAPELDTAPLNSEVQCHLKGMNLIASYKRQKKIASDTIESITLEEDNAFRDLLLKDGLQLILPSVMLT